MMVPSESQPPRESARARGSGGDIQSKGFPITDIEDADSHEESEGGGQAEASGSATAKEG
jgi:hypothetical protein